MTIPVGRKPKGRPKVGASNIGVLVPPDQLAPLDAYIAAQPDPKPGRPEAIRMILAERFSRPVETETTPTAAPEMSSAEWRALWYARKPATDELCRALDELSEWRRDRLLSALAGADVVETLYRYGMECKKPKIGLGHPSCS